MEFRESVSLALGSLRTNKMRSILTLLGIIIGIMAVVIIMTLGRGLQNSVTSGLEDIGASKYAVFITEKPDEEEGSDENAGGFNPPITDESDQVTLDQLDELKQHFGDRIVGVDIQDTYGGDATYEDKDAAVDIAPVLGDSMDVRNVEVAFGRAIEQQDIDSQRPVAVVSQELVDAFFDGDSSAALGKRIDLNVESTGVYTIIGVAEAKEKDASNFGQETATGQAFVPLSSIDRISEPIEGTDGFLVQAKGDEDSTAFRDELQNYVDRWYSKSETAQAEVLDMQAELASFTKVFGAISAVIASIAGISLLVGGIGVMNVMLITVTERTREIGVRKALGATRRDIRTQFIVEAVMVCLLGGIIGVVLGGIIGTISSGFIGMVGGGEYGPIAWPPLSAVLFSLLFSMAIGVFFGAYPANRAAKMQPIDALRYE
ncbi:ABC transporter permease [Corynebacterium sp. P3-F1]|uniref:ABC transporter permease n=1 Tax=Corynebacterium sp. P3-F1 TaxID=3059080 RepID=UPI00265D14BF|nr:ABC transporter permease [Corynebacterium sp. P3-F1]WKK61827.1 ABC transporter permease [Corynebacterium sp. P3-F1]